MTTRKIIPWYVSYSLLFLLLTFLGTKSTNWQQHTVQKDNNYDGEKKYLFKLGHSMFLFPFMLFFFSRFTNLELHWKRMMASMGGERDREISSMFFSFFYLFTTNGKGWRWAKWAQMSCFNLELKGPVLRWKTWPQLMCCALTSQNIGVFWFTDGQRLRDNEGIVSRVMMQVQKRNKDWAIKIDRRSGNRRLSSITS